MNDQQLAAFEAASGATVDQLLLAIASVTLLIGFLWASWMSIGSFMAWQDGQETLFDLITTVIRVSVVLLILGYYIR